MKINHYIRLLTFLFILPINLLGITLLSNIDEAQNSTLLIRGNVRYAHQFTAGSATTITSAQVQHSASSTTYIQYTEIRIHTDSAGTVGTDLGSVLAYDSRDGGLATYTGSITIPSTGTYWIEIRPTINIANHYYTRTSSTEVTASGSWNIKKTLEAYGGSDDNWTSYYDATARDYPRIALFDSTSGTQTVTTLAAAVDLSSATYLQDSGTTLDLSGSTLIAAGQSVLEELTGLDGSLDGIDKSAITTLKLGGNTDLTSIPADIFATFPNLENLELQDNTGITTISTDAFSGLSLTGNLRLDGNTSLTSIPTDALNGLTVGGNLLLNNLGITTIGANAFSGLTVSGNLQLNNNSNLTTIAASAFNRITVTGDLQMQSNTNLTSLSATAFSGGTIGGTISLTGNTSLTSVDDAIITDFFSEQSTTGDIRLDNTAITSLKQEAFKSATVSNDLRIDNTNITKVTNKLFKGATVGNDLRIDNNTALTEIEPLAFYNMQITGDIYLENSTALTSIPWCAFDAITVNGLIKLANSGLVNAMPSGADKTTLINGATKEQLKRILRKNLSLTTPVKMKTYAEIVKIQNKSLGILSPPGE